MMFLCSVLVGAALGFLSGLGTGGGSLLILYLTLALNMPQNDARAINLLFFIPCAFFSCLMRYRQGALPIKKVLPAIIAGSIFAAIFSFFTALGSAEILSKLFGLLLLFTGVRELLYRPKQH